MEFLGFIPTLIFLILVGAVVYAIVAWRRREHDADPGIGTVRRLYFYIVSFVALMMASNGLVQIVRFVLDGQFGPDVLSRSNTPLAIGASLVIVGLPLWAVHWRMVQRYVAELPVERRSLIRKAYLYLVLGVSVALLMAALVGVLRWLFGGQDFGGYNWAAAIVWPLVWAFHWRLESAEGQPTAETLAVRRLQLYLVSLAGLAMAAVGFGRLVGLVLLEGYDSLLSVPVLLPSEPGLWRPSLRAVLALGLVGGATWAGHWLLFARRDLGSALRQVYLYLFAILGGAVTVLVSLGFIIFALLTWLLGVPDETATTHFRFLPGALAGLSVGVGLWAYHWSVVQREAQFSEDESLGARRAYAYILSALGLGALVVAIGTLVNTALVTLAETSRPLLAGEDRWREPVALVITLVILGTPIWGYYWAAVQRRVSLGDTEERTALARRIYIFAALGAGMLALLGSVSALIFFFLRDLLGSDLSLDTLRDTRPVIDIIAAAVIFLPYHWLVYRQDRRAEPVPLVAPERLRRKEVTVLVSEGGDALVRNLEAALGYRVIVRRWADPDAVSPDLSEEECQELAQCIGDAAGQSVLLVPDGTALRVLSYD